MPHSEKYAKRLLSELHLPDDVAKVLRRPSYWDPRFVQLYFDRCEELIFRDPRVGLKVALIGPDLALLVPEDTRPDKLRASRERLVRAYAILGGAYRAVNQPHKADEPYRRALKLSEAASPLVQADTFQRLAILRAFQKRFDEAIRLSERAAAFFRSKTMLLELSGALAAQAYVYTEAKKFSEALPVASEGLCYSDPKLNPRVHYSLTHNFAYAAAHSIDLATLHQARIKIREARRLLTHHRRSIPKLKLYWVEGILMQKLFARGSAERLFEKARIGFLELGAVYESALATLDLSGLLYTEGRWTELELLAAEAFERFCAVAEDVDALAALNLWFQAVKDKSLGRELLATVREIVLSQMVRHRGAP